MPDQGASIRTAFRRRLERDAMASDLPDRVVRQAVSSSQRPSEPFRSSLVLAVVLAIVTTSTLVLSERSRVPSGSGNPSAPKPMSYPTVPAASVPRLELLAPCQGIPGCVAMNVSVVVAPLTTRVVSLADPVPSRALTFTPFPLADGNPDLITAAGRSGLWFSDTSGHLGNITTGGSIRILPSPPHGLTIAGLTQGADGSLWVAGYTGKGLDARGDILRVSPSGGYTEVRLRGLTEGVPQGLAANPDGIWFPESPGIAVGEVRSSGALREFDLGPYDGSFCPTCAQIAAAPDGGMWFTTQGSSSPW